MSNSHNAFSAWRITIISILLALVSVSKTNSQTTLPLFGPVFYQDEVSLVHIYLPSDSLSQMILEESGENEYACSFQFVNSLLNETAENVTIRLRGNTSLNADKKSFQISFNGIQSGLNWQGFEKMNLIGLQNDPSIIRSKLCHDMFRYANVPSARTSFVMLYINDEYRGLYMNQEHIDEEFASLYFDEQGNGNLYKCTYPADLDYLGNNPELYQFSLWGTRTYDLKTNEWADDYSDLSEFINILNNAPSEDLICELQKVFHIESYLRVAAIDVLSGNWDGYIFNNNNFYLYHNQSTGLFEYIPYDLDNTLGIDWFGVDWADRDMYEWSPEGEARPLFNRLLETEYGRNLFSSYVNKFINEYFNESVLIVEALNLHTLIAEPALADPYRPLDFGFDEAAFLNSITSAWGEPHVDYGIEEYINLRRLSALDQLEAFEISTVLPEYLFVEEVNFVFNSLIEFRTYVQGIEASEVLLEISTDNINFSVLPGLNDQGLGGDLQDSDNIYSLSWNHSLDEDRLYYRLLLPDGSHYPCESKMIWLTNSNPGIVINEVMSNNTITIADEYGGFNGWVELFNGSNQPLSLSGKFLTDKSNDWNKFPLPEVSLDPGDFILIWLDDNPYQGPLHANFKMDSNDEELWLVSIESGSPRVTDYFTPCVSLPDNSQERTVDGENIIEMTDGPTPGSSNSGVNVLEQTTFSINIFPNPATDEIIFSRKTETVEIFDLLGRQMFRESNVQKVNIHNLKNGQYILKLATGDKLYTKNFVIAR